VVLLFVVRVVEAETGFKRGTHRSTETDMRKTQSKEKKKGAFDSTAFALFVFKIMRWCVLQWVVCDERRI
jgi:hypothetical protein